MRTGCGTRRPGSSLFLDNLVVVIGILKRMLKECVQAYSEGVLPRRKSEKISLILNVAVRTGLSRFGRIQNSG